MMNSRHELNNTPGHRFVKYFGKQSSRGKKKLKCLAKELTGMDRIDRMKAKLRKQA
jgi:hypothetical protein